jgi:CheY-like chemotaxis protein
MDIIIYSTTQSLANFKSQIKIIALTAGAFETDRQQVLDAGCDDFVRKPLDEQEIFETMGKHLGVRYVYEKNDQAVRSTGHVAEKVDMTPEALAALPNEVLTDLEQAAIEGDVERMPELIEAIRSHSDAVADAVAEFTRQFKYRDIWSMIQQVKKNGVVE